MGSSNSILIEPNHQNLLYRRKEEYSRKINLTELANLKVYPTFHTKLRFEFVSHESVNVRIDLYDLTGRFVRVIFE